MEPVKKTRSVPHELLTFRRVVNLLNCDWVLPNPDKRPNRRSAGLVPHISGLPTYQELPQFVNLFFSSFGSSIRIYFDAATEPHLWYFQQLLTVPLTGLMGEDVTGKFGCFKKEKRQSQRDFLALQSPRRFRERRTHA